jgi:hypothetical protein
MDEQASLRRGFETEWRGVCQVATGRAPTGRRRATPVTPPPIPAVWIFASAELDKNCEQVAQAVTPEGSPSMPFRPTASQDRRVGRPSLESQKSC